MKQFLGGLTLGVVAAIGLTLWVTHEPGRRDERWALPTFQYLELNDGDYVAITGTLLGDDLAYKMNTYNVRCIRSDAECRIADVEEIGYRQLGEISIDEWPVTSWTDTTIVAQSADTTSCNRVVLTINRVAKQITYTRIPQNRKAQYCHLFKGDKVINWMIGQPRQPWEKS
jgi:hypothetical protein